MGKFSVAFSDFATSTANKTAAKIIGATGKKFEVVEVIMTGSGVTPPPAAPGTQHECKVAFLSNSGAGTPGASPTPTRMKQASSPSQLTAGISYSAEPITYETNIFTLFGFSQYGGMRWGVPQGEGYESDGGQTHLSFGALVISSAAGKVSGDVHWWEP
jgi:hypothetical protein